MGAARRPSRILEAVSCMALASKPRGRTNRPTKVHMSGTITSISKMLIQIIF